MVNIQIPCLKIRTRQNIKLQLQPLVPITAATLGAEFVKWSAKGYTCSIKIPNTMLDCQKKDTEKATEKAVNLDVVGVFGTYFKTLFAKSNENFVIQRTKDHMPLPHFRTL